MLRTLDEIPEEAFSASDELYSLETGPHRYVISAVWCELTFNTQNMWYSPFQYLHPWRPDPPLPEEPPALPHRAPWADEEK